MEPAILKAIEIGMHTAPIVFDSPLCPIFWGCLLAGSLLQLILLKKAKRRGGRWGFAAALVIGLLVCEIGCQMITGWDLLIPIVLYFYLLTMLTGAALCALVAWAQRGRLK